MSTFHLHNQGRNWRRIYYNREIRLLLLGLYANYWEDEYIEDAIGSFAQVISWTSVSACVSRVIVRAWMVDIETIPQFVALSDSPGFEGDSWAIQCEVIQHEMLGASPADEDWVPVQQQVQGILPFDFFGLGSRWWVRTPSSSSSMISLEQPRLNMNSSSMKMIGSLGLKRWLMCRHMHPLHSHKRLI